MSVSVNVRMFKTMRTPIKVGVRTYATCANCRTLETKGFPTFSGGIEMEFWTKLGKSLNLKQ